MTQFYSWRLQNGERAAEIIKEEYGYEPSEDGDLLQASNQASSCTGAADADEVMEPRPPPMTMIRRRWGNSSPRPIRPS